jgi:foldase protein PrsA
MVVERTQAWRRGARTLVLRSARCISAAGAVLVAVAGFAGCGGGAPDSVVARVGQTAITEASLDQWMSVRAGGGGVSDPLKQRYGTLRQQALGFLISSRWLIGEAADQGLKMSAREIEQRFEAKKNASFPGGEAEFQEFLKATGQTVSDTMFEAKAELAASKIRQMLTSREPRITRAQIAGYYNRNRQSFAIAERRELEITNRKSTAQAQRLRREVESGRRLASVTQSESIERPRKTDRGGLPGYLPLEKAIYSAKPNVLIGPVKQGVDYYLLEVNRVTAGGE